MKSKHPSQNAGGARGHRTRRRAGRTAPWESYLLLGAILAALGITLFMRPRESARPLVDSATGSMTNRPAQSNATAAPAPATLSPSNPPVQPVALPGIESSDPVELVNYGKRMLEQGRIREAVAGYRKALRLNPDDEEAHFSLAFAYARAGRTNDAIQSYTNALEVFPDYVEAHLNLANLLIGQGQFELAVKHLNTALKIDPEYAAAWNSLGRALAEHGKTADAVMPFSEAVRLDPKYLEARFNLGQALTSLERWDEAEAQFREALRINPQFQAAQWGLQRLRRKRTSTPAGR